MTVATPEPVRVRTLRVRATGTASLPPDQGVLEIEVTAQDLDYGRAAEEMNRQVDAIRDALRGAGVDSFDLKTRALRVSPRWDRQQVERKVAGVKETRWESRFLGYHADQTLRIEVPLVGADLAKALRALAAAGRGTFQLSFALKHPDELKRRMLEDAVRQARRAAETMTVAAGALLGPLLSIDHSWSEHRFETRDRGMECCDASPGFSAINPEDIEAEDSVTCVWELV